jgi:hypothetical protein
LCFCCVFVLLALIPAVGDEIHSVTHKRCMFLCVARLVVIVSGTHVVSGTQQPCHQSKQITILSLIHILTFYMYMSLHCACKPISFEHTTSWVLTHQVLD